MVPMCATAQTPLSPKRRRTMYDGRGIDRLSIHVDVERGGSPAQSNFSSENAFLAMYTLQSNTFACFIIIYMYCVLHHLQACILQSSNIYLGAYHRDTFLRHECMLTECMHCGMHALRNACRAECMLVKCIAFRMNAHWTHSNRMHECILNMTKQIT